MHADKKVADSVAQHPSDALRAKAPWYVSGTRTRHFGMPVLQIISEPTSEVLALVPYSDRTPNAHAQCYADARLIAAAPDLLAAAELITQGLTAWVASSTGTTVPAIDGFAALQEAIRAAKERKP